ncbi:MAG: rod shape-determining protein RodA [Candidatus Roizmanbacteria bacterium]|nr:MAG: rod shape-determining protein RodA [Candidatus Roizmanbacteria bacterium]
MGLLLLLSFFLYTFGLFNLLGINSVFFKQQIIFGVIGFGVYLIMKKMGLHFFRLNARFFYILFVVILILTFLIGLEVKGSRRWINLVIFNFQASEFFKFFFIIFLADFFTVNRKFLNDINILIKSLIYFSLPALIIFKQPDLGNTIVYFMIFLSMAFFSGIPKKNIAKIISIAILIIPLFWFFLKDYQKARILSFLNPHFDTSGSTYNMIQAIITVGSGQFFGRGLGAGTQSGLSFLPENHTDFAFSSLVEQFGFVGGTVTILLYFAVAYVLIKKITKWYYERNENARFNFLFLIGFFSFLTVQIFINIGMNLGIMPITGITLPFISYGGSSLITLMIGLALIP